jgi:hypothetical protein
MKRKSRLSTCSATSSSTAPAIWLRNPCSAMAALAAERPAFNDALTS